MNKKTLIGGALLLCAVAYTPLLNAQTGQQSDAIIANKERKKTITLEVKGMSCQKGCADGLDAKFKKVNGILKSKTTFDDSTSKITYDASVITKKEIIAIIEKKGFKAKVLKEE